MQLNRIKNLQYNTVAINSSSQENTLINTVLVSQVNSFDYPDSTPFEKLVLPFSTLLRARDYLAANNLDYVIKVLAGNYIIPPGANMDHIGQWSFDEGTNVEVQIGQTTREYLFSGATPARITGKAVFTFFWEFAGLYYPYSSAASASDIEAKEIRSAYPLLGVSEGGYLGGWGIFRNIGFTCLNDNGQNLFIEKNLKSQVFRFTGCTFSSFYFEIENYSQIDFVKCTFYGFINSPQVIIGAGTTAMPNFYAASFMDCDFDLHSNFTGGILLTDTGVKLCIGRSRFNRGDFEKYAIKNDYANIVAVNAISTAPISGSIPLNNVYGSGGFQYINPELLPYLLTL